MVVTEEIVKCWMCSDRPITHCLITGTLPKGYGQHPLCERCATKLMSHTPMAMTQMKSSNSSIFVSMNVIRISRMNYAEMYLKECVLILSIV